jgi:hypothetical protein
VETRFPSRQTRNAFARRSRSNKEHDLFGKPVSTFPDHALEAKYRAAGRARVVMKGNNPQQGDALDEAS